MASTDMAGIVDVIICTNRGGPYLARAIASVSAQTIDSWRLIIVDDGSPTPQEIDVAATAVPDALVIHREHRGVSSARNAGIHAGRGEFIAFLDDDDIWPEGRLDQMTRALDECSSAVAVCGDGEYIDADEKVLGGWKSVAAPRAEYLTGRAPLPGITALLYRRSVFDVVAMFDENFGIGEDLDVAIRLVRQGPIVHCGSIVVLYRRHSGNVTNAPWESHRRAWLRVVRKNIRIARSEHERADSRMLRALARSVRRTFAREAPGRVIHLLRQRRILSAMTEAVRSFVADPAAFAAGIADILGRGRA